MENTIKEIQRLVDSFDFQNIPLMKKPSESELEYLSKSIYKGEYIKRYISKYYGDPTWLCYPEGVEEKIEDNKPYKVWLNRFNDANGDINIDETWRKIKYIEEISPNKIKLIKYLEKLLTKLNGMNEWDC
jgi:hypothetical protein